MCVVIWAALFAPGKTSPAVIDRLQREVANSLARPEVKDAVQRMAMTTMVMTPEQHARLRACGDRTLGPAGGTGQLPKK